MTIEIGSEFNFYDSENSEGINFFNGGHFVFCGRTAIEVIIQNTNIQKVCIPSYCCDSMIEPFRKANIDVCFYNINYYDIIHINLNIPKDIDAILWCNYFGFRIAMPDLSEFLTRGGIIIEDITHSLMSEKVYDKQSTYLVASLRKWEPIISGGYCASLNGDLLEIDLKMPSNNFVELKKSAMKLKSEYLLSGDTELKNQFLDMFQISNQWLTNNYSSLDIDEWSKEYISTIDINVHKKIRRENAVTLFNGLEHIKGITPMFDLKDMDCPLFVPVIISPDKRNVIRQKLTDNQIYCPVHWPHPKADCVSNLYDIELSLLCDQRYNTSDMERIISVLEL